jgi:hypothetical protein
MMESSSQISIEQFWQWTRQGLTHHEMIIAVGRTWPVGGMTGDEVIVELAAAWNGLNRHE